jgi:hypothetical protein
MPVDVLFWAPPRSAPADSGRREPPRRVPDCVTKKSVFGVSVKNSNRSHMSSHRVFGSKVRILKIGDQRLAREIGRWRRKIQKIARQRLRDVSLTLGNVARIFANRT